jgi:hypothetical protein
MTEKENISLPATTTNQEDITKAGQRKVNLIWEYTQASIAIVITLAIVYCAVRGIINEQISNAFFLIIGFYFSRTNHAAIGSIGKKPMQEYEGR